MTDTGFFMAMGGIGISLAGFAGLFSALNGQGEAADPAVYRWRIREIVISAFQLTFLGFGAIALYGITEDVALTSRVISFIGAALFVVAALTVGRKSPAWPDDRDRQWARGATLVWALLMAGNVVVGSEAYLQIVMLILLLRPALVFIRAVVDATASTTADP